MLRDYAWGNRSWDRRMTDTRATMETGIDEEDGKQGRKKPL